jgi:hypothetical protein
MARLVAAGVKLRKQVDRRFKGRSRRSDGWIGDAAHQAKAKNGKRGSDHNPWNGWVHAIDIDADLIPGKPKQSKAAAQQLADELIEYAASGKPGADRIKYVVYNDRIASGTYAKHWWKWRGRGYGHRHHIHVSFTNKAPIRGRRRFPLPILRRRKQTPAK